MNCSDMRIELTPSTRSFLNVYFANFNYWFLTLKKGLYEMRTYHKQRDKNIETLRLDRLTLTWYTMIRQLLKTWQLTRWQKGLSMHVRTKTQKLYLNDDECWKSVCLALTLSYQCNWNSNKLLLICFERFSNCINVLICTNLHAYLLSFYDINDIDLNNNSLWIS